MIFGKESETLEFKKTTGELKEAVISVASILNKSGKGELYFGIKNDGAVLGQQIGDATLRDVSKALSDNLKPQIFPTIDTVSIFDRYCIRVAFEGNSSPYYAYGRAYIRVADEDKQMSTDELETFIIRRHERVSNWDSSQSKISLHDIDASELEKYIGKANSAGRLNYQYTNPADILGRLKLLENGILYNTAEIMFGLAPRLELQMAVFASNEKLTFNDIFCKEGRVIDLVDAGEQYIRNNMRYRVIIDGTQLERKEFPEVPHTAIREALLNSFCHKNYRTPQNNEIAIYKNRIEIYNPGTFPDGIAPEDYINGQGRPIHRNPELAQIMYYSKDIERFGTGLQRIADACDKADIKYEFVSDSYGFTVIFYRPPMWTSDKLEENLKTHNGGYNSYNPSQDNDSIDDNIGINTDDSDTNRDADRDVNRDVDRDVDKDVNGDVNKGIDKLKNEIINAMKCNPRISAKTLSGIIGINTRNTQKHITELKSLGIIERIGSPKGGYWVVKKGG